MIVVFLSGFGALRFAYLFVFWGVLLPGGFGYCDLLIVFGFGWVGCLPCVVYCVSELGFLWFCG